MTGKRRIAALAALMAAMLLLTACGRVNSLGDPDEPEEDFSYPYILPNVSVGGIDVGGLTKDDALEKLNSQVSVGFEPLSVTVTLAQEDFVFSPQQTVAFEEPQTLVDLAYDHGRTGDDKADYDNAMATSYQVEATPVITVDYDDLRTQVEAVVECLGGGDNESVYELSDDALIITRGSPLPEVDVEDLFLRVKSAFESRTDSFIYPITESPVVELEMESLWQLVSVEPADAHYDLETGEVVDEITGISFDLESANDIYRRLDYGESAEIPLEIIEPEVTAEFLANRLFEDLLGSCDSTLEGSTPNRKSNLELVCQAINGTVLEPGDVFSYNDTVGERTAAKGYKEAGVYIGGQTQDQLGGGICQAASTIYLASLRANLEIVERHQHDFLVTYVPMGCDATVYWQVLDFKFKNDTNFPLRIDAWVSDDNVHVELWGTNITGQYAEMTYNVLGSTGYEYEIVEDETQEVGYEKITTYPYVGYSVDTYRNVYDKDGNLLSTAFEAHTNYKVRNQVTTIGTKGKEPEPTEEQPVSSETGPDLANPTTESPTTQPTSPLPPAGDGGDLILILE